MKPKTFNKKELKNKSLGSFNESDHCKISMASKEIMLDRIYNGKRIGFPFSK